jgi:hypothetical protein
MASQVCYSFGPRFAPRSAPVTFWYLVSALALWFGAFLLNAQDALVSSLAFGAAEPLLRPWTFLTHPWVWHYDPFSTLLLGYVVWWSGADTEQWWGSRVHGVFLAVVMAATAGLLWLSTSLLGTPALLAGAAAPLCAVLTIWCLRHLHSVILLIFIPVPGWLLLTVEVLVLWMSYGPVQGLFAVAGASGLPALYYYQGHRLHRAFNNVRAAGQQRRRAAEQRERDRRVKEIFERSGLRSVDDD